MMPPTPTRPTHRAAAALVAALAMTISASACTVVGAGAPRGPLPPPAPEAPTPAQSSTPARVYGGSVPFGGDRIPMVLELSPDGQALSAHLSIPSLALDAGGPGWARGEELTADLTYEGPCPGHLTLDARFVEGSRRIEGRLKATDCTGVEQGDVLLLLRPSGSAASAHTPSDRDGRQRQAAQTALSSVAGAGSPRRL